MQGISIYCTELEFAGSWSYQTEEAFFLHVLVNLISNTKMIHSTVDDLGCTSEL